jgi:hypothetical protein
MESGMTYPPALIATGPLKGVTSITRRFKAGLRNFEALYKPLVNEWQRIDNGGPAPRLLSEGGRP